VGIDRFKPTRAQAETVGQTDVLFSQGTGRIITRPLSYALFKVIAGFVSLGRIAAKKNEGWNQTHILRASGSVVFV
jgi:hypothetical protein